MSDESTVAGPPTNCKITITMDQSAVDAATSAGEYVNIVQSYSGGSIDNIAWVAFAPALSTVVSWSSGPKVFVSSSTPESVQRWR